MPLWSVDEWRGRIGSCWCATGRSSRNKPRFSHQKKMFEPLQLVTSAETALRCGVLMGMIGIITGYEHLMSWISRCKRVIKGELICTSTIKVLSTIIVLLQVLMAVQTSLLMRSGDVERNPGPGRYPDLDYSSVENVTILGEDDFRDVFKQVRPLTDKWFMFGVELGLPMNELSRIKKENSRDSGQAITEMLLIWLSQGYNVANYGRPTWRRLVEAVDSDSGGNNHALAKMIASNHPIRSECDDVYTRPSPSHEDTDEAFVVERNVSGMPSIIRRRTLPTASKVPRLRAQSYIGEDKFDEESIIQAHRDTLATYYMRQVDDRAWPPVKTKNFIQLSLIKDKCGWRKTIFGAVDKTVKEGDAAAYSTIFDDLEAERFVLFEGRPGSGKTTLMNKISRDWACRDILKPYLLLLVPLRRLNSETDRNIRKILKVAYPGLSTIDLEQLTSYIEDNQGEGIVFAFDGLDEYVPYFYDPITKLKEELPYGTKKPLRRGLTSYFASGTKQTIDDVFQIMYGKCFTKALVIVSSRPSACAKFREYAKKRIEVLGFLKTQITDYILHYFDKDDLKAKQLILHLEQHPNLMNMAYLPLHCAMLAFLYEEETLLPETETKFYEFFTISTLLRDMRKRHGGVEISLKSLDHLPEGDRAIFDKICHLAFTATVKSKQVFTAEDVKTLSTYTDSDGGSLGLVVVDHCFTRYGLDDTYTFLHLTFQEYLAAVHIARLTDAQKLELIKNHRKDKHLPVVWKFLCGMIDFTSSKAMDIFKSLLETFAAKDKLFQAQCCHESQSSLACEHMVRTSKRQLKFASCNLTPSDCTAIGYTIHESDDEPVNLVFNECSFNCEGAVALLERVEDHSVSMTFKKGDAVDSLLEALTQSEAPGLQCLLLSGNNIGDAGADLLAKGLKNCTSITKLDLSYNKIGANGAQDLAEGLEFCTELQELDLSNNPLTDQGIEALSSAIQETENLRQLQLNKTELSNGIKVLSEAMEKLTKIEFLSFNKNSIDDDGAKELAQALEEMTSLKQLHLNHNYIGQDGQEALVAAAKQNDIKIKLNNQYSGI